MFGQFPRTRQTLGLPAVVGFALVVVSPARAADGELARYQRARGDRQGAYRHVRYARLRRVHQPEVGSSEGESRSRRRSALARWTRHARHRPTHRRLEGDVCLRAGHSHPATPRQDRQWRMDQRHRNHGGNLHEADADWRRQDDSPDGQGLQDRNVHGRSLEERCDGRGISVLGQPDLYEASWPRPVSSKARCPSPAR